MAKLASSVAESLNPVIFVKCLREPTIKVKEGKEVNMTSPEPKWASQIIKYMKNGELPEDKDMARKVKIKANRYLFFSDTVYKRIFTLPLLRCLSERRPIIYFEKYTREYVKTTQGAGQWPTKPLGQDTISL